MCDAVIVEAVRTPVGKRNGGLGATALGHPLGGSATRTMTTLVHHVRDDGIRYGLQTMCEGGSRVTPASIELL